jgi:hypothetical protein
MLDRGGGFIADHSLIGGGQFCAQKRSAQKECGYGCLDFAQAAFHDCPL